MENEISTTNARILPIKRSSSASALVPERVQDVSSPTSDAYLDPPPTYSRATEDNGQGGPSSNGSTAENTPIRDSTTTSVVTTTTTTTTTTTSTMTSLKRAKSIAPSRTASSGSTSTRRKRSKSIESFQSANDPYLDSLLARSVAALELSNALLQSTLTTKSTLSSVLASEEELERQEKRFEERLLEGNESKRMEWMQMMDSIVRDVESLFDEKPNHGVDNIEELSPRRMGLGAPAVDGSGLVLGDMDVAHKARSQPPRALTQYVVVSGANARAPTFAAEATADKDSIFLPSTTGLRSTAHKEAFKNTSPSKGESSTSRRTSVTSVRPGHSPMPSSSSGSNRPPPPPTHPEALPLSAQELLELREAESRSADSSMTTREGLYEYLRGLHTHSASPSIASASSTVSKRSRQEVSTRPVLSPHQPRISRSKDKLSPYISSPSTAFTLRSAPAFADKDDNRHTRLGSTASASTLSSSASSPRKYSSNPSFQLPISFPSAMFRRSPSLKSPTPLSPTESNASFNSETTPFDWYSPSLAAIPDQHEDVDVGLDRQGTIIVSGSAPSENFLGHHVQSRGRSPRISPGLAPGQGRAILRGRFKTADTLRKLLDTSPSPHPSSSSVVSQTSTIDEVVNTINSPGGGAGSSSSNINSGASRSNTDASHRTITIRKSSNSRAMSRDNTLVPASISYDLERGGGSIPAGINDVRDMHAASSSSIASSISLLHSTHSPSGFSSTSDLPSTTSASDLDRRKSNALTLRRPAPRFMPRTPSGMTAGISVSGATARAPKMRAHLIEEMESPIDVVDPLSPPPASSVGVDVVEGFDGGGGGGGASGSSTAIAQVAHEPSLSERRRRTKPLTVSVSSKLEEARTKGDVKAAATAAATGRRTSGSKLKGSPAWHAERKLAIDSVGRSPLPPASAVTNIHGVEVGVISSPGSSNPGSKRTSWIGVPVGLLGLAGLNAGAGGAGATASSNSSIHNGTSTPPMRVSFAKEPVKYSVERDSMSLDEEEDEEEAEDEEDKKRTGGAETEVDGGRTIRPTDGSILRRSQSWDGSIRENTLTASAKGKGKARSNGLRRVPSRSHSKKKRNSNDDGEETAKKKDGWLEWFLGAMTAGPPNGAVAGPFSSGTGGFIGREELFESRGRDDW